VTHIAKMLELTGVSAADARKQAASVLAFETRLAAASLPRVEMRKPENRYHFVSIAEAGKVTPDFDWAGFFKAQGANVTKGFSLSQPKFFAEMQKMLGDVPASTWQAYFRYHAISNAAPYLSAPCALKNAAQSRLGVILSASAMLT
jgi:putative endopeptidase